MKIFKEIETLDEALQDFPILHKKIHKVIDYIKSNKPSLRFEFGHNFVKVSKWSIKSTCKGKFGGAEGHGTYFSWRGIQVCFGKTE